MCHLEHNGSAQFTPHVRSIVYTEAHKGCELKTGDRRRLVCISGASSSCQQSAILASTEPPALPHYCRASHLARAHPYFMGETQYFLVEAAISKKQKPKKVGKKPKLLFSYVKKRHINKACVSPAAFQEHREAASTRTLAS